MYKKHLFSLSLLCILLFSCSAGNVSINNGKDSDATVKKTVKIGNFSEIDASQGIKVTWTQGQSTGKAMIATTPSAEPYLKVYVKDGCLYLKYDTGNARNVKVKGPTIVKVSSPELNGVDLSSSASLTVSNAWRQQGDVEFDLSSAASVSIASLECRKLEFDASSSAKAAIQNLNASLDADMSSASSIRIKSLKGGDIDAECSSAAKMTIDTFFGNNINVQASSAGSISISGIDCDEIKADASSGAGISLNGQCRWISKDSSSGAKVNISGLKRAE